MALPEEGSTPNKPKNAKMVLNLAYQSLGVIFGDLCTSPLYVYKTTFSGKLSLHEDDEEVFGVLSFIFWTFTLIPLFKYIIFILSADDNGEGGPFALYSLLCRHAGLSILPNQQSDDNNLSTYRTERTVENQRDVVLKEFISKHPRLRNALLAFVLLGTCMSIADGVLTPTISVLAAVSGLKVKVSLHQNYVVAISCVILVVIFSLQHLGTHRVAFIFGPVIVLWLIFISGIGVYNIFKWNPRIVFALSPSYMFRFLKSTGTVGWISLGGVALCVSGTEAMFAGLGHFSALPIKITFTFLVYPCMIVAYMGEAAFLSKNHEDIEQSFYKAVPEAVFWPVFIVATFAAVVGSQAAISASFSLVSQCCALSCFPRVKIVHTSKQIYGQIYIPEVNWILMFLCLCVTIGLRHASMIGYAYGLSITTVMFVTTFLMSLVFIIVWKQKLVVALSFLVFFGSIELLYISATFVKIPEGGWIPLVLAVIFMVIMYVWNYGTLKKHEFDMENKISVNRILSSGPSLGMVRVPGIGVVYADLVTGLPALIGHFATNLPAFHQVLVFVCIKSVQVPHVPEAEQFVVGRIGAREYSMFRCIVRYGYKDLQDENYKFENKLVANILEFVETEAEDCTTVSIERPDCGIVISDAALSCPPISPKHNIDKDSRLLVRTGKRVATSPTGDIKSMFRHEGSLEILKAKESGVAYIVSRPHAKAKDTSPLIKKFAIDFIYAFLSKNCRGPEVIMNVPYSSLLEVGMVYQV